MRNNSIYRISFYPPYIGNTLVHNYCFSGYGAEFEMGIKFHNLLILKKESRPTFRDRTTFFYYKSLSAMTNNMIANNSLIFITIPTGSCKRRSTCHINDRGSICYR